MEGLHNRATYRSYPFLDNEEFAEVCHYLESKYIQATLGPIRKEWRLDLHTALNTSATSHADLVTFVQITKSLGSNQVDDELASHFGNVALSEPSASLRRSKRQAQRQPAAEDSAMVDVEEADKEVLRYPARARLRSSYAVYEIHLHPTYRAPCLWFTLRNLPIDEPALDIDTVFRRLVPDEFKQALRGQGAIGGISIEHHPITSVPTFFVHPCMLGDAMNEFNCSKPDYLTVWLGLVGGCVGLWVPKEMAVLRA
ncbi:hypothetical protein F4808DRAFT_306489 [Astrocystis sublimbata]|nr:hypothetical protein F4808DRAFT_306489 [Astrocystis sublimbata]